METIKIKLLHKDAKMPVKANDTDAGYDLFAIDSGTFHEESGRYIQYRTGIAIEPPEGYHIEIFPRSSISKTDLVLANSIGLIDNGYRNEILLRFKVTGNENATYKAGERIGQMVIRKTIDMKLEEVDELGDSERGLGGFGSSGK